MIFDYKILMRIRPNFKFLSLLFCLTIGLSETQASQCGQYLRLIELADSQPSFAIFSLDISAEGQISTHIQKTTSSEYEALTSDTYLVKTLVDLYRSNPKVFKNVNPKTLNDLSLVFLRYQDLKGLTFDPSTHQRIRSILSWPEVLTVSAIELNKVDNKKRALTALKLVQQIPVPIQYRHERILRLLSEIYSTMYFDPEATPEDKDKYNDMVFRINSLIQVRTLK